MIRILLADDHQLVREGLRELLRRQKDFVVEAEAKDGREAVELAKSLRPDVAVIDVSMPLLNGVEATKRIKEEVPETLILALSMLNDHRFVERMLMAGASGYLLKNCAAKEMVEAIRLVVRGHAYLSPEITGVVVDRLRGGTGGSWSPSLPGLTSREREVLQLLAEGKSTKDIAGLLCLSPRTVESHRQNLLNKTGARNLVDLIKFAFREGLADLHT